jgi:hypothetical protein
MRRKFMGVTLYLIICDIYKTTLLAAQNMQSRMLGRILCYCLSISEDILRKSTMNFKEFGLIDTILAGYLKNVHLVRES